jgi:hypothetical protein
MRNSPEAEEERQKRLVKEVIDGQIRLSGELHDKAVAYNTVVMAIGYAGFFGLWSITKDYLTQRETLWAATLMLVSLSFFVFFEVYKGFVTGKAVQRRANAMFVGNQETDPETFLTKLELFRTESVKDAMLSARIWPVIFLICVFFGVAAVTVLFVGLVMGLAA